MCKHLFCQEQDRTPRSWERAGGCGECTAGGYREGSTGRAERNPTGRNSTSAGLDNLGGLLQPDSVVLITHGDHRARESWNVLD